MQDRENQYLEFKEAKQDYDFEKLVKYCAALANEGGGHMVLGVTDKKPRRVVGTHAFTVPERTVAGLVERLHIRVDAHELQHPDGRVLVLAVPSRPVGVPIQYKGAYWMRGGEDLVPMTPDQLQRIFAESEPDFSATTCEGARLTDLDPEALRRFRHLRDGRASAGRRDSDMRMLEDAELVVDGRLTYAALILLGSHKALGRYLAQAEIIFEFRADETIHYDARKEWRRGFLTVDDELWQAVAARDTTYPLMEGMVRRDIRGLNERAFREAVLNAVCHRDYRLQGSIFVKQWPSRTTVTSPGGFPPKITPENLLFVQAPRNRRLADAFARLGLVERSGQGADLMFEAAVREGKTPLDYRSSDEAQVVLTFHARVEDEGFLRFIERLTVEVRRPLMLEELIVLESVRAQRVVPDRVRDWIAPLVQAGAVERAGKGRLLLGRQYFALAGHPASYTRKKGLNRATQRALLLQHITEWQANGATLGELCELLPELSRAQVQYLLSELKDEGRIRMEGRTRSGRWFPAGGPEAEVSK